METGQYAAVSEIPSLPDALRASCAVDRPVTGPPHDQAVNQHDGRHPSRDKDRYGDQLPERSTVQEAACGPDEQSHETSAPESGRTQIRKVGQGNPPFRAPRAPFARNIRQLRVEADSEPARSFKSHEMVNNRPVLGGDEIRSDGSSGAFAHRRHDAARIVGKVPTLHAERA
jgi:hypothetical protein